MSKGKNVLTTGQVAKICNVAPRTVSKWFDKGHLRGYRIPDSKDRRIPVNELMQFMKTHNMPITGFPLGKIRVLIVGGNNGSYENLESLQNNGDYEVQTVSNTFETGLAAQRFAPHVILINLLAENIAAEEICKSIRADEDMQTIKIIALSNQLSDSESDALLKKGFDGYVTNPDNQDEIVKCIEEATAIVY